MSAGIETSSQLELLPGEILELITDKLAYYECFNLSLCSLTLCNLMLNSEPFWKRRVLIDMDCCYFSSLVDFKSYYKEDINQIMRMFSYFEHLEGSYTSSYDIPISINYLNLAIKCRVSNVIDRILRVIMVIANSLSVSYSAFMPILRTFYITLDGLDDKFWREVEMDNGFCYKFIADCVRDQCLNTLKKFCARPRCKKMITGLNIIKGLVYNYYPYDETLADNSRNEACVVILNLGLKLIEEKIDDMDHDFIGSKGIEIMAKLIYICRRQARRSICVKMSDQLTDRLVTRICKMDYLVAKAIWRRVLIISNADYEIIMWCLYHSGIEIDLDMLIMFSAKFPPADFLDSYKQIINMYIKSHPGCISPENHKKIMAYVHYG